MIKKYNNKHFGSENYTGGRGQSQRTCVFHGSGAQPPFY